MVDSANGGCGSREQTVLEAAKVLVSTMAWSSSQATANLRAAIAREEAKPSTDAQVDYQAGRAAWWQIRANEANDRAQQAEADAKWHREESARLSAELSLAKNQMTLAIERSERLSGGSSAQFYGESPYQTAKDASEAVDPCTGWTFATYRRVVEALGGKS